MLRKSQRDVNKERKMFLTPKDMLLAEEKFEKEDSQDEHEMST